MEAAAASYPPPTDNIPIWENNLNSIQTDTREIDMKPVLLVLPISSIIFMEMTYHYRG